MSRKNAQHQAKYDAKQREAGWVRGPRISGPAADHLRRLAFVHKLDPREVVSRLILGQDLGGESVLPSDVQVRLGLSAQEMRELERIGGIKLDDGVHCGG